MSRTFIFIFLTVLSVLIIYNGSTILESANGVTITRDFEVREGAEFEIKISN